MGNFRFKDLLLFQSRKDITNLYKRFLGIAEDLQEDHITMIEKLKKSIPPEYHASIDNLDYFDDNKFNYIRKKILDIGNESIRQFEGTMQNFEVFVKREDDNEEDR